MKSALVLALIGKIGYIHIHTHKYVYTKYEISVCTQSRKLKTRAIHLTEKPPLFTTAFLRNLL